MLLVWWTKVNNKLFDREYKLLNPSLIDTIKGCQSTNSSLYTICSTFLNYIQQQQGYTVLVKYSVLSKDMRKMPGLVRHWWLSLNVYTWPVLGTVGRHRVVEHCHHIASVRWDRPECDHSVGLGTPLPTHTSLSHWHCIQTWAEEDSETLL